MISRFHFPDPLPADGELALPEALAHHAVRVLRLAEGDPLVLFDGRGDEIAARLSVRGKAVFAVLGARSSPQRESPLQLVLVQALATGDKMDWIVQKAVELGVAAIQPIQAERSVLRLSGERMDKRLAHWRQIIVAACEQSGRNLLPRIEAPLPLASWLQAARGTNCYMLAPGGASGLDRLPRPVGPVQLMIGPEGGWSAAELAACAAAGCTPVGLGPRVLRTETAGLAAIAALQAWWGDFRA